MPSVNLWSDTRHWLEWLARIKAPAQFKVVDECQNKINREDFARSVQIYSRFIRKYSDLNKRTFARTSKAPVWLLHNTTRSTVNNMHRRHAVCTHLRHSYSKDTGSAKCSQVQQRTLRAREQSRSSCSKFPAFWHRFPLINVSSLAQLSADEKLLIHIEYSRSTFPYYFHIQRFEWPMTTRVRATRFCKFIWMYCYEWEINFNSLFT